MKITKHYISKFLFLNINFLFLSSCVVIRQEVPSQNTACFTDKKQFEGVLSGGATGVNVNLAYSPLKYLSLQCNGYSSLTSFNSSNYNNQMEVGIGTYLPLKRFINGLNFGYGQGSVTWQRWWYATEGSKEDAYMRFDTKKIYLTYFFAYKFSKRPNFCGFTAKLSALKEHYYYEESDQHRFGRYNFTLNTYSVELTSFWKLKLIQHFYFTGEAGLQISEQPHPVARAGLVIKF
jgi:hypothetical protein